MQQPKPSEFKPHILKGYALPTSASLAAIYACGTRATQKEIRKRLLPGATKDEFEAWVADAEPWRFFARLDQLEPAGDWQIWLYQAGRGAGKTRAGTEWLWEQATVTPNQLCGVLSPTHGDLTNVTFGGPSGLMRLVEQNRHLVKRAITQPWTIELHNGSKINSFTAESYERLRGPQHHAFLFDEAAGAARVASSAFEQIMFGLRLKGPAGETPRLMITSTPKTIPLFKRLNERLAAGDKAVAITRASTMDNAANLSQAAIDELVHSFEGTRLGEQELYGKLLTDVPNALWKAEWLQRADLPQSFTRIVVAVDPSGAASKDSDSDEIGIVVAGLVKGKSKMEDRYYVLEDCTMIGSPLEWARRAVQAFNDWEADRIVAETNYGGAMVTANIKHADPTVPVRNVTASRGKSVRAEPVSSVYEQGRAFHTGASLSKLEDQMLHMTTSGYAGEGSPDRVDALVWAITDLMLNARKPAAGSVADASTGRSYWKPI